MAKEKTEIKKTKGQITRENILTEALDLYSLQGVQNTPFQNIADRVGITQAALYKYFSDRDELLKEAILFAAEKGREFFKLKESDEVRFNAQEKFYYYIEKNLEWAGHGKPFNIAFLSVHYFATQIEIIGDVHKEIYRARTERMASLLEELIAEKFVKVKNKDAVVLSMHNYLLGEMLEAFNRPRHETKQVRSERVIKNIESFLK